MSEKQDKTTELCGYDESNIMIRNKNLVTDLMGKLTFTEMVLFHITGKTPTPLQLTVTDAVLVTIMEHGLVPSAIVSRLTLLGAPESFQGAVAAGLLGVGDRYAGTASECAGILEKVVAAAADREHVAREIVREYRASRRPLPGFSNEQLVDNVKALLDALLKAKPSAAKGTYMKRVCLSATWTPSVTLELG